MGVDLPDFLKSGETARLIPAAASGRREQHAASIFLATLSIVRPYGVDVLATIGKRLGRQARIAGLTEIVFRRQPSNSSLRPDGLLILETSRSEWRAIIEAKIGTAVVDPEQIAAYAKLAAYNNIDAVISISNELTALPDHPPYNLPSGISGKVAIFHWSWMKLMTLMTLRLGAEEEIDAEQRYILREALRYFSHENVGVRGFQQMPSHWRQLVGKFHAGANLLKNDIEVVETVRCWHQEQHDICLMLARQLNVPVSIRLKKPHRDNHSARIADDSRLLVESKQLCANFDVPNLAGQLEVVADILTRHVVCRMQVQAPDDLKKTTSRVNWLLRQLPDDLDGSTVVHTHWKGGGSFHANLRQLRENPGIVHEARPSGIAKAFDLMTMSDLDRRFFGAKTFIDGLESAVPHFYDSIARHIKPWFAPPPPGPASLEDAEIDDLQSVLNGARRPDKVLQRGTFNGRSYAVFEDGSIEVETADGLKWFEDLAALQSFAKLEEIQRAD